MSALTLLQGLTSAEKQPIIFIIGPYADKWFSAQRPEQKSCWIVAPEAADWQKNLQRLRLKNSAIDVRTFFPFFPDGKETETLAQMAEWRRAFSQQEIYPCVLGIYARLSSESAGRSEHSWWSGSFDLRNVTETDLASELNNVLHVAEPASRAALHRYAMKDALHLWLIESGTEAALQSLFSGSSLKLTAVLLADSGEGFTCHGAWARWLHHKFRIYPGLAPTASLPSLPETTGHDKTIPPCPDRVQRSPWRWLPALAMLLLTLCMSGAFLTEARLLAETRQALRAFQQSDADRPLEKFLHFKKLKNYNAQLARCRDRDFIRLWQFSGCSKMIERISGILQLYKPVFRPSASVALFAQGSAELEANADQALSSLLPLIADNPETVFMILGHSDNTGTPATNFQLSLARAETVRDWFITHTAVSPERLIVKGLGDSKPVANNNTAEGRQKNRRVEMIPLLNSAQKR